MKIKNFNRTRRSASSRMRLKWGRGKRPISDRFRNSAPVQYRAVGKALGSSDDDRLARLHAREVYADFRAR